MFAFEDGLNIAIFEFCVNDFRMWTLPSARYC